MSINGRQSEADYRTSPVTTFEIQLGARRAYQVNEAAAAYRLSRSTLYKLMAAGTGDVPRNVEKGGAALLALSR